MSCGYIDNRDKTIRAEVFKNPLLQTRGLVVVHSLNSYPLRIDRERNVGT
jgi:hypothetical protein